MNSKVILVIPLMLFLLVPTVAFSQTDFGATSNETTSEFEPFTGDSLTSVDPVVTSEPVVTPDPFVVSTTTFESHNISTNIDDTETFTTHTPYVFDGVQWVSHILTDTPDKVTLQVSGATLDFNKITGAVTIFDDEGTVIDSDSYVVRTALVNSDVWNNLSVNDGIVTTTVEELDDSVTVSFIRENIEGLFKTEYVIGEGQVKTTAYFTNYIYDNNKFAFTQTLNLPDSIITLNDDIIDLTNYVGQSFPRSVLEQNEDLVLNIKDMYYNSGLGFENLWSVNVTSPTKVSLDYANVSQTQTAIGETVELDPTISTSASTRYTAYMANSTGTSCSTVGSQFGEFGNRIWVARSDGIYTTSCSNAVSIFDISTIPSGATVTDTSATYIISSDTINTNCDFTSYNGSNPSSFSNTAANGKTVFDYVNAGTVFYGNDANCRTNGTYTIDLGSSADSDIQTNITNSDNWWGLGFTTQFARQSGVDGDGTINNITLSLTYTLPVAPDAPTGLTATNNAPNVDLSWITSVNQGSAITGYKIETSTNGTTWTNVVANASPTSAWTWDASQSSAISVSGTTITNSNSGDGWNNYIRTSETVNASTGGGSMSFKFPDGASNSQESIGFGKDPINAQPFTTYNDIEYTMTLLNTTTVQMWQSGSHYGNFTISGFDPATSVFRIDMDGSGNVSFYHNNTLIRTSAQTASGDYYIHATIYTGGNSIVLLDESYTHTAPVQNTTNYYKVSAINANGTSYANTVTTSLANTSYRTYIDNASSTSCVATGTIYEDGSRGTGIPTQGSGNRYCESTSMEYDISGIPDSVTIIEMDIDEIHNIWSAGWNPSCEYKANTTVQPSTGTGAQKYSATQTGTVYAYDPLCTTTAGTSYNVPLSVQANTDLQNQLSSDWFAISWTMGGFPVISQAGSSAPSSVNSGSATLNVLHTAPVDIAVGGTPDAPTGLTATFNTTTADMDLAWSTPANNGSAITGYKIEVSTDGTNFTDLTADTGSITTTHIDTNPTMGSLNYYKVSAINAYGESTTATLDATGNQIGIRSDQTSGSTCPTTTTGSGSGNGVALLASWGSGSAWGCDSQMTEFDTSAIPDGATITNIDLKYDTISYSGYTSTTTCDMVSVSSQPSISNGQTMMNDLYGNTDYVSAVQACVAGSHGTGLISNLGNQANTDLQNQLSSDWFAVGTKMSARNTSHNAIHFDNRELQVTYINPSVNVMAGTPPDEPTITGTSTDNPNTTPLEITVNWSSPLNTGTAGISNFEVYRDGVLVTTVGNVNTYTDTVPSGGTFVYSLKSVTAHGTSILSATASHTTPTPPPAPSSAPTLDIANPNPSPFDVTVTFAMPSSGGSAITSFEIFRSIDDVTFASVGTTSTLIFSDTVPSAGLYYYKFASTNLVGSSGQSPSGSITTATVPDSPTVTLAINNPNTLPFDITATFVAPASDGGSALIDYDLQYSDDNVTFAEIAGGITGSYNHTVATAGTHYFQATVRNNVGDSVTGVVANMDTPTLPSVPLNATSTISNVETAPYTVIVSWETPTSNGGSNLTGYDVYRKQGSASPVFITNTTALTLVDTVPSVVNTNFTYQIYSVNNVGQSATYVDTVVTTNNVPLAPALNFTAGTTSLSWNIPTSDATITGYKVFRDSVELTTVTTLTHTDWTLINFGQSYTYEVKAVSVLGDGVSSNSIVTMPETEITGMIAQGITGTGAVIDWDAPAYYQGNLTYNVWYVTPSITTGTPTVSAGTTLNTYSNFAPQLDYNTSYTFGVTITSPLGNSGFSNLVTLTTNVDGSIVSADPTTGGMAWFDIDSVNEDSLNVIEFQRETQVISGVPTDTLQVAYPSWWDDMTCNVDYKFAQKTEQYVEGTDMTSVVNANNADQQVIGFQFQDVDNEVIEVQCAPQQSSEGDEGSGVFVMTQNNLSTGLPDIPMVTQIGNFSNGSYGTDGDFGALNIVGLFAILISMVGFNRVNPIVGVFLSASLIFALSYFGIISIPIALITVLALVIFLAWGISRRR